MVIGSRTKSDGPRLTPLQQLLAEEDDLSVFDRPSRDRMYGNILVAAQFLLLGLCLLPLGPAWGTPTVVRALGLGLLAAGAVVLALGLAALRGSTRVHPIPAADSELRTTGIYAVVRHPMYLSVMLFAAGLTVSSGRLLALLSSMCLLGVLTVKARFEERLLSERFGWEYAAYCARVPAILPQPWRGRYR